MALLEIKDFNVTYRMKDKEVYAVQNACIEVEEQDAIGIVGESGSGKSTLAMGALRLLPDNAALSGQVLFEGQDLCAMSKDELSKIRWNEIAVVFQKSMNSLSPVHRIGKQMEDVYLIHRPGTPKKEIKERIYELFRIVNLSDRVYNLFPHELSGGMMQRIAIALSLIMNPKLLVMDEATTALDVVTQSQILREIIKLQKDFHLTRLMITHDVSVVSSTCNKVVVMYAGNIMEKGDVVDVLVHPKHPYTQGLLKSFPSFHGAKTDLRGIPGALPELSVKPAGCVFAPRCPYATEQCRTERPALKQVGTGTQNWQVACHLAGGDANE